MNSDLVNALMSSALPQLRQPYAHVGARAVKVDFELMTSFCVSSIF